MQTDTSFTNPPPGGATAEPQSPFVVALRNSHLVPPTLLESLIGRVRGDSTALEQLLLREGYCDEKHLQSLRAEAYGWTFIDLQQAFVNDDLLTLIPRSVACEQNVVPFAKTNDVVRVATLQPGNAGLRRLLEKKFGTPVELTLATPSAISGLLKLYDSEFHARVSRLGSPGRGGVASGGQGDDSVVDFVDALLSHGIAEGASDIHIEPHREQAVVRERIDGLLRKSVTFSKKVHERLTQRIKVMASLATDEHAAPQDGKLIYWTHDRKRVDVRVSIVPTADGEKIVLRLLVSQQEDLSLGSIGCSERNRVLMEEETKRSWGMFLVTGPTGSGKSTTLYTVLKRLSVDTVNLSTIEDPIEYEIAGANQIQVNEKTGLTFATGLKALVRQDPNIILVGEIRDRDTAGIAVNAAMTGHLVFSTLHTNNAATAIPRLVDLGIEPFLISSMVNVVVAQRLVRTLCPECREPVDVKAAALRESFPEDIVAKLVGDAPAIHLYQGRGCDRCHGSGFTGRTGIFEVMVMDPALRELVSSRSPTADAVQKAAIQAGMTTMIEDGLSKVKDGVTSLIELLRVLRS